MKPNSVFIVEAGNRSGRYSVQRCLRVYRDGRWNLLCEEGWLMRDGSRWFTLDEPQLCSRRPVKKSQVAEVTSLCKSRLVIGDVDDRYVVELTREGAKWLARHGRQHMLKNARVNLAPLWRD